MLATSNTPQLFGINDDNGFGNGSWWVIILLLFLFGGFNGFGNNGAAQTQNDISRGFDTQQIVGKLDSIGQGICQLGYVQQNQFGQVTNAMHNAEVTNMQQTYALTSQLAQCCCENRLSDERTRHQMSDDTCQLAHLITSSKQEIEENANRNYRALHDQMVTYQMDAKDATINELQTKLQTSQLYNDQKVQTDTIINAMNNICNPTPVPSYSVPNPHTVYRNGWDNGYGNCNCGGYNPCYR